MLGMGAGTHAGHVPVLGAPRVPLLAPPWVHLPSRLHGDTPAAGRVKVLWALNEVQTELKRTHIDFQERLSGFWLYY